MSKRNDDFFKEKKLWSVVKDELLACYFKPYVAKILTTRKPLVYIDCFAGKGKFEDGVAGSPLIALNIINECISASSIIPSPPVTAYFIDLNYANDLHKNLPQQNQLINIISGAYEYTVENILSQKDGRNIFLYIDPYGIKALKHSLFKTFSQRDFYSIELLVNLNSFGFIREACHALGKNDIDFDKDSFDDIIEYDTTKLTASEKSIEELTSIAGGDYWIQIVNEYKLDKYDGYEAEKIFAEQYCKKLQESYKYVLNMPLRIKQGQRPKYRMVHATNHPDGCVLMADNICTRWEAFQQVQSNGSLGLWEEDFDNNIVDDDRIRKNILDIIPEFINDIKINDFLANFFCKFTPFCNSGAVKNAIKTLEAEQKIHIARNPPKSPTGKASVFLTSGNGKEVYIRSTT